MRITRSIFLALLVPASALAQPAPDQPAPTTAGATAPWRIGLAPRVGIVVPTSKLGPMVIGGLELDHVLPVLDHRLVLGLDVSLTRPSHEGVVMDPRLPAPADYTVHETELEVALLASYRLAAPDRALVPWVGVGPMLHFLKTTETTTVAPGENTAVSTELGVELGGGIDFRAGPGFVTGDARLAYSKLDHQLTGSTNAGKLAIAAGYRVVF